MSFIFNTLYYFEWVFLLYIAFSVAYLLFFSIAGLFHYNLSPQTSRKQRKIAVLIPGYKEDAVIVHTAMEALRQDYPSENYDIIIIADSFKQDTLDALKKLPIILVEVSFEKSTKSKALNKAMETIGDNYDVALVLDADNIMEPNFLVQINDAFNRNYKIVQGHRIAKNTETPFALLDAISEEINNYIFRKAHRAIGLSAALIGSGMAFDYALFKTTMKNIKAIGGFDKELEMFFLKHKQTIEYLPEAYVLDEKTSKEEVFANQRRRWLSAQFIYFFKNLLPATYHLISKRNFDYFDKMIQMGQLPRVILIGIVGLFSLIYGGLFWLFNEQYHFDMFFYSWLILLIALSLSMILSIPQKFYTKKTLKAILFLPKGIVLMVLALLKFKNANKKFIHTTHEVIKPKK